MSVINETDRSFFRENGYVVVRGVVPRENCEAVIEAIWGFMGKEPGDREGWYTPPAGMGEYMKNQGGGWAEMFHHPSLMANRQHPGVYQAFSELLGEERLWVSYDKVACKFPHREGYEAISQGTLHWDLDTTKLTPEETPEAWEGEGPLSEAARGAGVVDVGGPRADTGWVPVRAGELSRSWSGGWTRPRRSGTASVCLRRWGGRRRGTTGR